MVDLSVVIVSWNVCDLLRRCLASLARSTQPATISQEIIVVDNASTDGSVETLSPEFPHVHFVANTENRGFPAANNQGIRMARGRYVLLLNPDTEVLDGALEAMVAYADAHPDVGVIGPQLLDPDGSVQSSRRRFPTLATAFFESTWLQPYAPRRVLRRYYVLDHDDDETIEVDWVKGAALMARRTAIEQVGPLDEGFFMYSEELDWCRRFREAGWRVIYLPTAQIVHYEGKSSEQVLPARHIHFQTSKVRYFHKYAGRPTAEVLRMFILANYAWQWGLEALKWLLGHRRALRTERMAAYAQVLRSRLRPPARPRSRPRSR